MFYHFYVGSSDYLIQSEELLLGLLLQVVDPGREDVLALVDVLDQVQLVALQALLELGEHGGAVAVPDSSRRTLNSVEIKFQKKFHEVFAMTP
jgi:hypothetical protein